LFAATQDRANFAVYFLAALARRVQVAVAYGPPVFKPGSESERGAGCAHEFPLIDAEAAIEIMDRGGRGFIEARCSGIL
jgi:hypothetical protein